ncbi:S8 family serine peptidase [Algivirga pacifica]|uniref:Peptidase inhibitor I9 n=1 Tax=Algivirga pacifica TaxID=1162670 RepID=A0ABP9DFW3_9BACT
MISKNVLASSVLLVYFLLTSCTSETGDSLTNQEVAPQRETYIIVMARDEIKSANFGEKVAQLSIGAQSLLLKYGINKAIPKDIFVSSGSFMVSLTKQEYESLLKSPEVKSIERDQIFTLGSKKSIRKQKQVKMKEQLLPWGVSRIGGSRVYKGDKKVWLLDSGVDLTHPDLNILEEYGYNAFTTGKDGGSLQDYEGHGTHVAGIIGALDNTEGVLGVAAGVGIIPVKIVDQNGGGSYSGILGGLDFVFRNATPGDVVNLSVGGLGSDALDEAVKAIAQKGVFVVMAAGNASVNVADTSPARVNGKNIFTVSAIDEQDYFASYSNFGQSIDFAAPGENILSTSLKGRYSINSGTSMAAPHISGMLLFGQLNIVGNALEDPDNWADPIAGWNPSEM